MLTAILKLERLRKSPPQRAYTEFTLIRHWWIVNYCYIQLYSTSIFTEGKLITQTHIVSKWAKLLSHTANK